MKKITDKMRLDFLSKRPRNGVFLTTRGEWLVTWGGYGCESIGRTPREAIDAAIRSEAR